jgi:hypothetical protein
MSAPTPIPTLPITSATAAQSAHIASLTTQLHQLVEKNNTLTSNLSLAQKEGRERVNEEVSRSEEVVRLMRIAHGEEMKGLKESMETVSVALCFGRSFGSDFCVIVVANLGRTCTTIYRICSSSNQDRPHTHRTSSHTPKTTKRPSIRRSRPCCRCRAYSPGEPGV